MMERHHEAWLKKLDIRMEALERFVAALPGAADVDISPIKEALKAEFSDAHNDVVGASAIARWVEVAPDRLKAFAERNAAPEFDPED